MRPAECSSYATMPDKQTCPSPGLCLLLYLVLTLFVDYFGSITNLNIMCQPALVQPVLHIISMVTLGTSLIVLLQPTVRLYSEQRRNSMVLLDFCWCRASFFDIKMMIRSCLFNHLKKHNVLLYILFLPIYGFNDMLLPL